MIDWQPFRRIIDRINTNAEAFADALADVGDAVDRGGRTGQWGDAERIRLRDQFDAVRQDHVQDFRTRAAALELTKAPSWSADEYAARTYHRTRWRDELDGMTPRAAAELVEKTVRRTDRAEALEAFLALKDAIQQGRLRGAPGYETHQILQRIKPLAVPRADLEADADVEIRDAIQQLAGALHELTRSQINLTTAAHRPRSTGVGLHVRHIENLVADHAAKLEAVS